MTKKRLKLNQGLLDACPHCLINQAIRLLKIAFFQNRHSQAIYAALKCMRETVGLVRCTRRVRL